MPPLKPPPERPKKLRKGLKSDFDAVDLRIILSIDEATTLGDVADKLGLSTPAISLRLGNLEKIFDIALIQRTPLRLTEAGRYFKKYAESDKDARSKLLLDFAGLKSNVGSLRVIAISSILIDDAHPALADTQREFLHLNSTLIEGASSKIIECVQLGKADIGLIGGRTKMEGLIFERYRTTKLVLLMHKDHPLANCDCVKLKDIERHRVILLPESNWLSKRIIAAQMSTGATLRELHIAPDMEIAAQYASTNKLGLCIVLEDVAKRFAQFYDAKIVRFSESWMYFELYTVTREIERRSEAMTFFINKLRKRYKDN